MGQRRQDRLPRLEAGKLVVDRARSREVDGFRGGQGAPSRYLGRDSG